MYKQVLHIEKPKAVPVINSIGEENDRMTAEQIAKQMERNDTIDPTRTHLNCDLIEGIDHTLKLNDRVNKRIAEGYTSDRKIRTDAVRVCDGVFGAGSEFFDGMTYDEIKRFGTDFAEFLVQKVGRENIIGCRLHVDEKAGLNDKKEQLYAIHVHFQFVPIKDGKLVRREFGISQNGLKYWHTECAKWMQKKGWKIERGEERQPWQKPVKHEQPNEFKRKHYSDKVSSVKLEKILHEIDSRVDISEPVFAELRKLKPTAEMSADDFYKLRDIAGQVISLRHELEELRPLKKEIKSMRKSFTKMQNSLEQKRDDLAQEQSEVADKNAQREAKRLIAEYEIKSKELDRKLAEVRNAQSDAIEIANGLIEQARQGNRIEQEHWEQLCIDSAVNDMKKNNPEQYKALVEAGRKIVTKDMHDRQRNRNRKQKSQEITMN